MGLTRFELVTFANSKHMGCCVEATSFAEICCLTARLQALNHARISCGIYTFLTSPKNACPDGAKIKQKEGSSQAENSKYDFLHYLVKPCKVPCRLHYIGF